jgi:hypothetical protein
MMRSRFALPDHDVCNTITLIEGQLAHQYFLILSLLRLVASWSAANLWTLYGVDYAQLSWHTSEQNF